MEKINVETLEGIREELVYTVKDVSLDQLDTSWNINKGKGCVYSNAVITYDIETTTIVPQEYVLAKDGQQPYGFMYHWQMCLNGVVVFGRYWHEWRYLLYNIEKRYQLSECRRMVIYVHFLAYEFQFFCQMIHIDEIFATEKRKVLVVRSGGFEFRCSYRLSNKSLEKFCEDSSNCIHVKLTEKTLKCLKAKNSNYNNYNLDLTGFDYKKIRTPSTVLTMREKGYCFNDVMGLYECIKNLLLEDTIATIPLTSTGYVRRDIRKECQNNNYRKMFRETVITPNIYKLLKEMFRGGNCHANAMFTGRVVENVRSKDKQSSYPASIMMGRYPMGRLTRVEVRDGKELYRYLSKYCCMMRIGFINIYLREYNPCPYIDLGHCIKRSNVTLDNGRVIDADFIEMSLTEIDFEIIDNQYEFDSFFVEEMYIASKRPLPVEVRKKTMEYFFKKTTLKGIVEQLYFYVKSKNQLNAIYGMMVTAIAHIIYSYVVQTCEWTETPESVKEELDKYFESRSNFLAYQWGVYVTAISRYELQRGLDIVGNDLVYCDTDSVKYVNSKHDIEFDMLNKYIIDQCEKNDIPAYVDYNDKRFYLGVWEDEGISDRFITYGAKKYASEYDKIVNGNIKTEFKLTVSGMHKEKGAKVVGCINNFKLGKTYHDVGRTVSFYNDVKKHYVYVNGEKILNGSNVGVVDTTYTLGVTSEYWEYFNSIQVDGVAKIDD